MAINKITASAPCPFFAGTERRTQQTGWTMALPYKTYLTCEISNIASERSLLTVFNYDLAEYVANQAGDAYAFGVYVETGGYTDAISDAKHMYAAKFFLKLSEDYSLAPGEQHNCDVRGIAVGVDVGYDLSGVVHGAYIGVQFKETSDPTTIGGYYLAGTATYGVIGLEVRTEAKDGGDGGIVVGAAAYGIVGILIAQKNDAAPTGNYAGIVLHTPWEGDAFVGTTYGIRFDTNGLWAGTDFDVGIDFGSQAIKAINIDACQVAFDADVIPVSAGSAAAIHVKTTVTTGLSVTNQRALYIETELTGSGTNTGYHAAIVIETYVTASTTLTDHHYGIYVATYDNRSGTKNIYPLRLEHNGAAVAQAFIMVQAQTGTMSYFMRTSSDGETWGSSSGSSAGTLAGYLKVKIAGYDRWIYLYDAES